MKIRRRDIVDWEPLQVELVLKRRAEPSRRLMEFVPQWLRGRGPNHVCDCTIKDDNIHLTGKRGAISFACEWMCDVCIHALSEALEKQFPEVDHIEIGLTDDSPPRPPAAFTFIKVPAKKVMLEDGSMRAVEAFEIGKSCVTVGQYEAFAIVTGYKTRAEREGLPDSRSYRNNELLISKRNRHQYPAYVMAYEDAVAYCAWAKVRLPTEAEWLAASILDDGIYGDDDFLRVANALSRRADALVYGGNDWTSTPSGDGRMRLRGSPRLVRSDDWRDWAPEAHGTDVNDYDLLTTFRVCKG